MRRFQVLNRIAEVSDGRLAARDASTRVCEVLVPEVADFCMIDLIRDGRVERIAVERRRRAAARMTERRLAERTPLAARADGPGCDATRSSRASSSG